MNEDIKLKSISELLGESFYIPSYQRGYRWAEQQIVDLLEDINEFDTDVKLSKNESFYCLQPIVVKKSKNPDFKWDVIDGQQRLTTIYLILKSAEILLEEDGLEAYKIGYETRKDSQDFLEGELAINENNIDFFHMSRAFKIINDWFKDKKIRKSNFIRRLLEEPLIDGDDNADKAQNVRVIWYEVADEENSNIKQDIDIFTRINMGKIPLTNAELIKALLLKGFKEPSKQFEIASQWDTIEYALQNDDFWLFINKEKNEQVTRIEFIFDLITEEYLKNNDEKMSDFKGTLNKSIDTYYTFHVINHLLQNSSEKDTSVYLWEQVTNYFRILNEWYEDREFFHKIGFLVIYSKKNKKSKIDIFNFIEHYIKEGKTKDDFRDFLDTEIKALFKDVDLKELKYDDDNATIRQVLLMFNILTIINNEKSNMRFQFDRYKNDNWDIEHIRSQTDNYPEKDKEKWIDDNKGYFDETPEDVKAMTSDKFKAFYDELSKKIEGEDDKFEKSRIGNLALLDASTNRSYGNAFFAIKRKIILENDTNGTFVPICTKNVFMKYYSEEVKEFNKWTAIDANGYENMLEKTLEKYLPKKEK
jgi:uncharacterized protein with ParB-like and HNH nuclease domain